MSNERILTKDEILNFTMAKEWEGILELLKNFNFDEESKQTMQALFYHGFSKSQLFTLSCSRSGLTDEEIRDVHIKIREEFNEFAKKVKS